jgi:hypothetical protein
MEVSLATPTNRGGRDDRNAEPIDPRSPVDRAQHVAHVASVARFAPDDVNEAIDRLLHRSLLVAEDQRLPVSPAGLAFVEGVRAKISPVVARAYAGISADELAITARVLTEITSRLSAELDQPAE